MAPSTSKLVTEERQNDNSIKEKIVISGMSGLFPESRNIEEFSDILYNKINPVTNEHGLWKTHHPEVSEYLGKIPGIETFDAQFFKVHYRLGTSMDCMGRKVLEQAYQAIYDAGVCPESLAGKKVGVFVGSCFSESEKVLFFKTNIYSGLPIMGCNKAMLANRISYSLDIKGPSYTVDVSCVSATTALQQAYCAILRGDCESAIVGACRLCYHPQTSMHYSRVIQLSKDGKTKSFGADADGCCCSEVIGFFYIQKAKDAKRIYGEVVHIKSQFNSLFTLNNNDFASFQRDLKIETDFIKTFYDEANVSPDNVRYVEAFGSATPKVDKTELEAIEELFCKERSEPLLVGSVMSNIGHSEAAHGVAAITKVLLGFHTGKLAANLHCESPRQDIAALCDGRMRIVTEHEPFDRSYAAVNCLSITGNSSHVLLHGNYKPKDLSRYKSGIPHLLAISARQEANVENIFKNLASRPVDPEELALLRGIHETKIFGHLGRGYVILDTNEKNETVVLSQVVEYQDIPKRPLWFVYSGMGSQWVGMGTQLMRIPVFAAAIERCQRAMEPKGIDVIDLITSTDPKAFENILHSFVGIAAIQIGLTDVLRALDIHPDKIIGHSVGELGCAYADGCLSAEEMILAAYSRGQISVQSEFIHGSMAAIGLGYKQISELCPPEIEVACHNSAESCTISGPAGIMSDFVKKLVAKGIFAREVPCSNIAYHSKYIAHAGPNLLKLLEECIKSPKPRSERWVSTSIPQDRWNEPLAKLCSAEYYTNNLISPVLFEETARLIPDNAVVIEIAPHGLLQAILKRSLPSCHHIPLTRRNHPDCVLYLLQAIGSLYVGGYHPKIQALYPEIEFPVSTGTPMLSHLMEWMHVEIWPIPTYIDGCKEKAALCNYVISLHDEDYSYLRGNVLRGKVVYPFAAALVAVWDTLSMVQSLPKRYLSVQFSDVYLHSQPTLHDQHQLSLRVAINKGNGCFEVLNENVKVISGRIIGKIDMKKNYETYVNSAGEVHLNTSDIYELYEAKDYDYNCDFRSIYKTNLALTEAELLWNDNWVTFIDGMIQLNCLKRNHETISQPKFIKRVTINTNEHMSRLVKNDDGVSVFIANVLDVEDVTRCGGVVLDGIGFYDLPKVNQDKIIPKALYFVPHFQKDGTINENFALSIFLQEVAATLGKASIKLVEIVNNDDKSDFSDINNVKKTIPDINLQYSRIRRESIIEHRQEFLTKVEVILITNLSSDDILCQILYRVLKRDAFIIIKEYDEQTTTVRPSSLYHIVSCHKNGSTGIELAIWRPTDAPIKTTAVTIHTESDIQYLAAILEKLRPDQKIVIISSYESVPALQTVIKKYRSEGQRKIHLLLAKDESLDRIDFDGIINKLVFPNNIFFNGVWGGEYYLPQQTNLVSKQGMMLKASSAHEIDSLYWVEAPAPKEDGVTVEVNYAGVNMLYAKRQLSLLTTINENDENLVEIDFSGITKSGERVMGLVREESVKTHVNALPELLWPVPDHWTLEDAATVPLAYCMAYYCLLVKNEIWPGTTILIHGGAGALGQAAISIALANDCEVFTTVSENSKKKFLMRLFPQLKEDHIGYSRDMTFGDMVLSATNGQGCKVIISCAHGDLKTTTLKCCSRKGVIFDTQLISNHEDFAFGMYYLNGERNFMSITLSSIFKQENKDDIKKLQLLVSEGIANGSVRPLTRITYSPEAVSRAFRLLAASRHRGRVLLHLQADTGCLKHRLSCSPHLWHMIVSNNSILGIQLAERLILRGAKKLILQWASKSNSILFKIRTWEKQGVTVKISYENIHKETFSALLLKRSNYFHVLETVFFVINHDDNALPANHTDEHVSKAWELCPKLKYFAIVDNKVDEDFLRTNSKLQPILLSPKTKQDNNSINQIRIGKLVISVDINVLEEALASNQNMLLTQATNASRTSILEEIAKIAGVDIPDGVSEMVTLRDLHMDPSRADAVEAYLRDVHLMTMTTDVTSLDVKTLRDLDKQIHQTPLEDIKSLHIFFSRVESNELLASTEIIPMQTLIKTNNDYLDWSRKCLSIIPGMESLGTRFNTLCAGLKLGALVLQLFNQSLGTVQDVARYCAQKLLKNNLGDNFYLLGYEYGVLVALETAAILEDHGLTGTVFCVGGSPSEVQAKFNEVFDQFNTEEDLQDAVALHMVSLMTKDNTEDLKITLMNASSWKEKVDASVRFMMNNPGQTFQYTRSIIESAYARILQVKRYTIQPRKLRSKIISMRPRGLATDDILESESKSSSLERHSQQQVMEHDLETPFAHLPQDLYCTFIVNSHLDDGILQEFSRTNLCATYKSKNFK